MAIKHIRSSSSTGRMNYQLHSISLIRKSLALAVSEDRARISVRKRYLTSLATSLGIHLVLHRNDRRILATTDPIALLLSRWEYFLKCWRLDYNRFCQINPARLKSMCARTAEASPHSTSCRHTRLSHSSWGRSLCDFLYYEKAYDRINWT